MSVNNFTGIVESVRKNDQGYWSIKTADGQWFGHGKTKPICTEGDEVAFDYSQNGKYNNADPDTMEVISSDNKVPAKKAWSGKKNASSEGGGKEGYWEKKEERDERRELRDIATQKEIRYQAARNAAIEVVGLAVKSNLLTIPAGKKAGDQFKVLLTYVDKVTDRFVTAVESVNSPAVAAPAAPKPKAASKPVEVVEEEPVEDSNDDDEVDFS